MDYWLAVGPTEHWKHALKQRIWGLTSRQKGIWEKLSEDDIVVFYATQPVCGAIGYGTVQTKFIQDKPLWPQEIKEAKVKWPLNFEFKVKYSLPESHWNTNKYTSDTLKLRAGMGFHSLESSFAEQIIFSLQPTSPPLPEKCLSSHDDIKKKLLEVGKLQDYIAEEEYPFDIGKLDVVWRKVEKSVPTYVFEVQVGGDIYHALAKLKHASDLWNSHIFLVATQPDFNKAHELLSGTFHEINKRIKFVDLSKIEELYRSKKAYFDLEEELGIG